MWSLEFRESILHLFYCGICATTLDTRRRTEDRFANFDWQPPKNPVTTSPLARSYLTRLLVTFSVRHALRRPSIKFGSKDMLLPVR
jgi:hypothetical protein